MAFDNVTFPTFPMTLGVNRVENYQVDIVSNSTIEYRRARHRWENYTFSIPTQTMTDAQKETIRGFLAQRNHGLASFRFVDPGDPTWDNELLDLAGASSWYLYNAFDESTPGGNHPMFNQVTSELVATKNGVPTAIIGTGVTNGVPTINVAGSGGGDVIRITGPKYYTVRLATNFSYALAALCPGSSPSPRGHQVGSIELQEVFGET